MNNLALLVEGNPSLASDTFSSIEAGLNQVLPGSNVHTRYQDPEVAVGLAIIVGRTTQASYNPIESGDVELSFAANNQQAHPEAWGEIAPEFLEGQATTLGRFTFFALAKTENMRITGRVSSYDPDNLAIAPGRVGFAGGRRLLDTFVTPSGLWEVHDHLVAGVFTKEVTDVAAEISKPRIADEFAEYFEKELDRIRKLHAGIAAADLSHKDIGVLLPLIDDLPSPR